MRGVMVRMMGTREIKVGMRRVGVGIREIRVGMWGIGVRKLGIRVGMWGIEGGIRDSW